MVIGIERLDACMAKAVPRCRGLPDRRKLLKTRCFERDGEERVQDMPKMY
jgi:hypothetical protein